ncbi:MAG: alpha/beta hydrolase [Rhodospirillaceae bacterium]|nr:alpha/beta hydrolase [Rhodospirillaceae bacterium]
MRRALVVLCAALLAVACAARTAPPGSQATTPALAVDHVLTADGLRLPLRAWRPPGDSSNGEPRAVVVALHGFNDYANAFAAVPSAAGVGPFLAERGFAVYAYDQRGFGAAPHAGLWPGADRLRADFGAVLDLARARHPGVPVFALGESMGGAVVLTALASAARPPVDGVILVAPAVWARATMPALYRVALWLGARIAPGLKPSGRGLGRQASDNIAMLRANAADPLFIKNTRIDAIAGLVDLMDEAFAATQAHPARIRVPVLYLYGGRDQIIPREPTLKAVRALPEATVTFAYYPDHWHMMLRDLNGAGVLADIAAWIADPGQALPSAADRDALARLAAAPPGRAPQPGR